MPANWIGNFNESFVVLQIVPTPTRRTIFRYVLFLPVVANNLFYFQESFSDEVHTKNDVGFAQFVLKQYGAITTFSRVWEANRISIVLPQGKNFSFKIRIKGRLDCKIELLHGLKSP